MWSREAGCRGKDRIRSCSGVGKVLLPGMGFELEEDWPQTIFKCIICVSTTSLNSVNMTKGYKGGHVDKQLVQFFSRPFGVGKQLVHFGVKISQGSRIKSLWDP